MSSLWPYRVRLCARYTPRTPPYYYHPPSEIVSSSDRSASLFLFSSFRLYRLLFLLSLSPRTEYPFPPSPDLDFKRLAVASQSRLH